MRFAPYSNSLSRSIAATACGSTIATLTPSRHLVGERNALFTDHDFHNTGIGELRRRERTSDAPVSIELAPSLVVALAREAVRAVGEADLADDGRLEVTGCPDLHHYRTPTLRNVALTAPYMHDGSLATLDQVVRYYDQGGSDTPGSIRASARSISPKARSATWSPSSTILLATPSIS